jgi:DNA-binding NtrC family response regulator
MLGMTSNEVEVSSVAIANSVAFSQGMTLREIEKQVILETLKHQNFNRTRAARVLGIGIRTLQRKLKQYRSESTGASTMLADA